MHCIFRPWSSSKEFIKHPQHKSSMKRSLKRLAMDLDSCQCCKKCGIIQDASQPSSNIRTKKARLCEACQCVESGGILTKTPCGQQFCQSCGFLIDEVYALSSDSSARGDVAYCFACCMKRAAFLEPDEAQTRTCECDFCSNHYDDNPSPCKLPRISIEQPFQVQKSHTLEPEVRICAAAEIVGNERQNDQGQDLENKTVMGESSSNLNRDPASDRFLSLVLEEIRNDWEKEQLALKKRLVTQDFRMVTEIKRAIERDAYQHEYFIAGVDISFIKGNDVDACAALTVISFPNLELVYKRMQMVKITAPYIPGFLAFREVDSIVALYLSLLENAPQYKPDIIFVDGNGQLHPRGFGLACHLGVTLDLPCVGVAKTLIHVDGIEDNHVHKNSKLQLKKAGDAFPLVTTSGECLGAALRSTDDAHNPIYVSVGHKISLASALAIVQKCCKYRIPEPTRQADILSREYLTAGRTDVEEVIYDKNGTYAKCLL